MFKQIRFLIGATVIAAAMELPLLPPTHAQISGQLAQVDQIELAHQACLAQARKQSLNVNSIVLATSIANDGRIIGSEVVLNVNRGGSTYNVRCIYDNASRVATILPPTGGTPPANSTPPTEGTFQGKGLTTGSVFSVGRNVGATLNFNQTNNFSLSLAVPAGNPAEVNYNGAITRRRAGNSMGSNGFTLEGQVRAFASSANGLRVINTSGKCFIEVFDSRVISSSCNTSVPNSSTQFKGKVQF